MPRTQRSSNNYYVVASLCLSISLLVLTACAINNNNLKSEFPSSPVVWPQPPDQPRVSWVKNIVPAELAPEREGFWSKLSAFLVGEEQPQLLRPYGVFADDKTVYIADSGSGRVHIIDTAKETHSYLKYESEDFYGYPIALTGNGSNRIYFTDSKNAKVYQYNPVDGQLGVFNFGSLKRPTGITFNKQKKWVYVSDTADHAVVVFDEQGVELFRFGQRGVSQGEFNFPTDLFYDRSGRLWVTDSMNFRVQSFTAEGESLGGFGEAGDTTGRMAKPKGIAVDSDGHVYVVDALFDTVQIFDKTGKLMLFFGEKGTAVGEFWMPSGLYIDDSDYIYVSDTYNQRIQVFRYMSGSTQ